MRSSVVTGAVTGAVAAAVAAFACSSSRGTIYHFDNDYEAARAEAQRAHLPLVVEVWAPW